MGCDPGGCRRPSAELSPIIHEVTALLEKIAAPIGRLDRVANGVGEGLLDNVVRVRSRLSRPISEGAANAMHRHIAFPHLLQQRLRKEMLLRRRSRKKRKPLLKQFQSKPCADLWVTWLWQRLSSSSPIEMTYLRIRLARFRQHTTRTTRAKPHLRLPGTQSENRSLQFRRPACEVCRGQIRAERQR